MMWIKFKAVVYRPWILPATTFWITILGWALYLGFNVAFPTETVYGLGASIWSLSAINSIYEKKGRPSTNPLIVHVPSYDDVFRHDLTRMTPNEQIVFKALADVFWPGPVTFVVRANMNVVHPCLTNGTNWVGLRAPAHRVAQELLRAAGVPIAAPSANRSGNVSPTTSNHVADDYTGLGTFMPIIGDDDNSKKGKVGIESTIVKVNEGEGGMISITFLRAGAIGPNDITNALAKMRINVLYKVTTKVNEVNGETSVAPGQELKHYSPQNATTYKGTIRTQTTPSLDDYSSAILIATSDVVERYGGKYHKYFTLPYNAKDCASVLYTTMREADAYCKGSGQTRPSIVMCTEGIRAERGCGFMVAINDKVFRASSGKEPVLV
jgi:L-threonylcarbamoyladenylate synthase